MQDNRFPKPPTDRLTSDPTRRDAASTNEETRRDAASTEMAMRRDEATADEETRRDAASTNEETRRDAASTGVDDAPADDSSWLNYFDPQEPIENLSGNLPHWRQAGTTYFVTFRLADSMPQEKLDLWRSERDAWLAAHPKPHSPQQRREYYERFTARFQHWLDQGTGSCVLAAPDIKMLVEKSLRHFHGERYRLDESVVMPNHVHALVTPLGDYDLSDILHSWKSYTAHEILKVDVASRRVSENDQASLRGIRGIESRLPMKTRRDAASTETPTRRDAASTSEEPSNHVWQKETFDHIVRSPESLERIRQYIRDNSLALKRRYLDAAGRRVIT